VSVAVIRGEGEEMGGNQWNTRRSGSWSNSKRINQNLSKQPAAAVIPKLMHWKNTPNVPLLSMSCNCCWYDDKYRPTSETRYILYIWLPKQQSKSKNG